MRRAILPAVCLFLVLPGCRHAVEKSAVKETPPEQRTLALIGAQLLPLGATLEQCESAYPPPEGSSPVEDLPVDPGLTHASWQLENEEAFAVALDKKGLVKAVHRLHVESREVADEKLANYAVWFGKGQRRTGETWASVVYERGGARLTLEIKWDDDFVTYNETLEGLTPPSASGAGGG
jgi:hypothetical protein